MKKIFIKSLLVLSMAGGFLTSCVEETFEAPVETIETQTLTPTTTVALVATTAPGATPVAYTADDIIEAYVTSSDKKGTFYKSVSFQTIPDSGNPIGFSVPIDENSLFAEGFTPGRKVYIKLKGLYVAKINGSMQIGFLFGNTIGRISPYQWRQHLIFSPEKVSESAMVRTMTVGAAYNDVNLNTLVELDMVQFTDASINRTYFDVDSGGGATNHSVVGTAGGTEGIIRFSSFTTFAAHKVPSKVGKIRGVLTKFGSTYQFLVRYEEDIKLTSSTRADVKLPFVGNAITYAGTLSETFESYSVNQNSFPKYVNDALFNNRYWAVKSFSGNKYIEMTSFVGTGQPGTPATAALFIPVDFTAANTFTFKEEMRFNAGASLKVYYVKSADYTPGSVANPATFTNITQNFNITYPAIGSSESAFNSVGTYNIPASLTGTGFFIIEYAGSQTVTTTTQIDDIVIN